MVQYTYQEIYFIMSGAVKKVSSIGPVRLYFVYMYTCAGLDNNKSELITHPNNGGMCERVNPNLPGICITDIVPHLTVYD